MERNGGAGRTDQQARVDEVGRAVRARFEADPPQGMTDEDSHRLNVIVQHVGMVDFPATRETLIEHARRAGDVDGEELIVELRSLAEGARFDTIDEALLALGVGTAGRLDVPGAPPRRPQAGPPFTS
jgi:hypothetical protein